MFVKIYSQIFDSSISRDYEIRHLFMDLLVLSDSDGVIDVTHDAIARRTNVPIEKVLYGIGELMKPDPASRSWKDNGARLVLIDPGQRDWGWRIVNYKRYRAIRDEESRRTYSRGAKRRSYIYYAVSDDRVRIGLSANPWARVMELKPIHPEIELLATELGNADLKRQRQSEFAGDRIDKDWFNLSGKLQDHIAVVAVSTTTVVKNVAHRSNVVAHRSNRSKNRSMPLPMKTETRGNATSHSRSKSSQKNGCREEEAKANKERVIPPPSKTETCRDSDSIQHAEAKQRLGKLCEEVFGAVLLENQWPNDWEHWLDEALPMSSADFDLIDWAYRLPKGHKLRDVTRLRQSVGTIIQNLRTEPQKIRSARAAIGLSGLRDNARREEDVDLTLEQVAAAQKIYGSDVLLPRKWGQLAPSVRAEITRAAITNKAGKETKTTNK